MSVLLGVKIANICVVVVHSALTHVIDVLPEGLSPVLHVFRRMHGQGVGYILSLTLCADVYTLRIVRISLESTDKGILIEKIHTYAKYQSEKMLS